MAAGTADQAFATFFRALKPGGILGVEEHRGLPDQPQDPLAKSGYVRQDYAVALAEKAGFRFVGASEVNANPRDTKDYSVGVWALPPTYRLKDQDRQKYAAIGESDRFVLKFVKP
jgi:predicted methyltransferase